MKMLLVVGSLMVSASAFATTTVICKSKNYVVQVADIEDYSHASYGVDGIMNDAADVEMENDYYLSGRIIAFSLNVDGQPKKIEVSATQSGKNSYTGKIYFGDVMQTAVCTRY